MTELRIAGGRALLPGDGFQDVDLTLAGGRIAGLGTAAGRSPARTLDARGLLILPGIIDLHGDAFERQLQPRPGVDFPPGIAVADTEAQLLASGVTTAYHGVTLSWEPGLRGLPTWRALLDALDAARAASACDMRVHLRWEAYNLDALEVALADIAAGRVHLLAFNDHTPAILRRMPDPQKAAKFSDRAGMGLAEFRALADRVAARRPEVPDGLARIAAAARASGLPMASHDDATVADRDGFRRLGAGICEFPMAEEVGVAARAAGDRVVMGAPNVVRGGSHLGWASAAEMVERGICDVLCSDYYYPALLHAPFVLARRGRVGLAQAWELVSTNPARAAGLSDRGTVAPGLRGDLLLVDAAAERPRVVATITRGQIAWAGTEGWARLAAPVAAPVAA